MSKMLKRGNRGFTLIEMLIVICVIAILALIVIPRLLGAGRKAKESALAGDLHEIRDAIQQFQADLGDYPAALADVMAANAAGLSSTTGGSGLSLDTTNYNGPYLRTAGGTLPSDPFTGSANWTYTKATGSVASASTLTALNGTAYNTW
jgi:type II secretion system protein G